MKTLLRYILGLVFIISLAGCYGGYSYYYDSGYPYYSYRTAYHPYYVYGPGYYSPYYDGYLTYGYGHTRIVYQQTVIKPHHKYKYRKPYYDKYRHRKDLHRYSSPRWHDGRNRSDIRHQKKFRESHNKRHWRNSGFQRFEKPGRSSSGQSGGSRFNHEKRYERSGKRYDHGFKSIRNHQGRKKGAFNGRNLERHGGLCRSQRC